MQPAIPLSKDSKELDAQTLEQNSTSSNLVRRGVSKAPVGVALISRPPKLGPLPIKTTDMAEGLYAYDDGATGEGISVYVVDSGLDSTHEEIKSIKNSRRLDVSIDGKALLGQPWPGQGDKSTDFFSEGHGTHNAAMVLRLILSDILQLCSSKLTTNPFPSTKTDRRGKTGSSTEGQHHQC